MTERWLPVAGYEGLYEVSDLGRVRSLPRQTARGRRGGRVLKHYISANTRGYPFVKLSRSGVNRNYQVHALVLHAFAGPRPPGQEARHGPGGKTDASLVNLSYGTRAENLADRIRDGQDNRGDRHYGAKLTWDAVAEIRAQRARLALTPEWNQKRLLGDLQRALARQYGVSQSAISLVMLRQTWRYPPE
jgi:NUMOD4 motif